jgi:hypothetical protein
MNPETLIKFQPKITPTTNNERSIMTDTTIEEATVVETPVTVAANAELEALKDKLVALGIQIVNTQFGEATDTETPLELLQKQYEAGVNYYRLTDAVVNKKWSYAKPEEATNETAAAA